MADLTVPQAAALLGLQPRSVRMFIERGMIKGEKRGRDWFITQEEVDRYNRERRKPGSPPGRQQTEATKAKLREIKLAHNPMRGKAHTPETRKKIAEHSARQPRGADSHAWKGGRVMDDGYILVYAPNHPLAVGRYVPEHRLIAEQTIGRSLAANEVVHHINGVTTDNRPENLQVMTQSEHARHHRSIKPNLPRLRKRG